MTVSILRLLISYIIWKRFSGWKCRPRRT